MEKEYCKVTVQWDSGGGKSSSSIAPGASSETRVLVFYSDKLDVMSLQSKGQQLRLERRVPYLDLRRIHVFDAPATSGGQSNRMQLLLVGGTDWLQFACSVAADCARIVGHIVGCLRCHLPQLAKRMSMLDLCLPADWHLDSLLEHTPTDLSAPSCAGSSSKCGHFCSAYSLYCAYLGVPVQAEIKWDVDTIYFSLGTRTFCLADFSHFRQADFAAIIGALTFNDHFDVLDCCGVKFSSAMAKSAEFLLTFNSTLRGLQLANCGLKSDYIKALANGIEKNDSIRLRALDLSNNAIGGDDKLPISQLLAKLSPHLERLNLSNCGLSMKQLNQMFGRLAQMQVPHTMRKLIIDSVGQKSITECSAVFGYLENASNLEELSCANCGFFLNTLSTTLLRLTQCLTQLDLSGNQFWPEQQSSHLNIFSKRRPSKSHETADAIEKAWSEFFATCVSLRRVRINRCRLPPTAACELLVGLSSNRNLPDLSSSQTPSGLCLEMAGNDFGASGAQVLCSAFDNYSIVCLESLDVSDNDFGSQVSKVAESVCNGPLRHLAIGGNNFGGRDFTIIQEFAELVTDSKCPLQSLSIRGARLEQGILVLLNALGQCKNLTKLDISDNCMSDLGAKILAKALHLNSSLVELRLDNNKLSPAGLRDVAEALQFNASLRRMPVPVADVARAAAAASSSSLASSSAASSNSVGAIQEALELAQVGLLRNNHSTGYHASSRDYRLHSELSSFAFTVDNFAAQIRVSMSAAAAADINADAKIAECVERCRVAMSDAESAKRFLVDLSAADTPEATRRCLEADLPAPVQAALADDLAAAQAAMLRRAEAACPGAFAADCRLHETLRAGLDRDSSCQVSSADVADALKRSAWPVVESKLSVLTLNSAISVSNYLQEVVIRNLQQAWNALSNLMCNQMLLMPSLHRKLSDSATGTSAAAAAAGAAAAAAAATRCNVNSRPLSVLPGRHKPRDLDLVDIDSHHIDGHDGGSRSPSPPSTPATTTRAATASNTLTMTLRPSGANNRRPPERRQPQQQQQPMVAEAAVAVAAVANGEMPSPLPPMPSLPPPPPPSKDEMPAPPPPPTQQPSPTVGPAGPVRLPIKLPPGAVPMAGMAPWGPAAPPPSITRPRLPMPPKPPTKPQLSSATTTTRPLPPTPTSNNLPLSGATPSATGAQQPQPQPRERKKRAPTDEEAQRRKETDA